MQSNVKKTFIRYYLITKKWWTLKRTRTRVKVKIGIVIVIFLNSISVETNQLIILV